MSGLPAAHIADASGLISLEALPGNVMIDEDARTVSVPASVRYGDLARPLQQSGWALSNLPTHDSPDSRRLVEAYDPRGVFRTPFLERTVLA